MLSFFRKVFLETSPPVFAAFQSSTVLAFLREGFLVTSSASGVGGLSWNFSLKNSRTPFMTIVKGEMLRVFFVGFLGVFPLQPRGNEILAISGVWIFEFLLELIFQ